MLHHMIFGAGSSGKRWIAKRATGLAHEALEGRILLAADIGAALLDTSALIDTIPSADAAPSTTDTDTNDATATPSVPQGDPASGQSASGGVPSGEFAVYFNTLTKKNPVIILKG